MPNNSTTRFVVVNPPGDVPRDSYMYMSNSITGNSMIVARGLTGLMTPDGFSRPIFFVQPNMRTIRLGFRVTEPVPAGQEAVNEPQLLLQVRLWRRRTHGMRMVVPVVLRLSRSRWAWTASASA
jgi:hypothetical protein